VRVPKTNNSFWSAMVPLVSVHFSGGEGSRSSRILLVQKAFRDYRIGSPFKVDRPALPGAQEWNPGSLQRRKASFVPGAGILWLTMTVRGLAQL